MSFLKKKEKRKKPWKSIKVQIKFEVNRVQKGWKLWQKSVTVKTNNNNNKKTKNINRTDLESDILECEVKWALESITTNKASGGDRIPVELSKSSKMMLWKCCTQHASKFGKLNSGHRTGKGQFSFQSQRKAIPKDVQPTAQLHSSHTLVK